MLRGFCWCICLASLPRAISLDSLNACASGGAECFAAADEPQGQDLFLLQTSAGVREIENKTANGTSARSARVLPRPEEPTAPQAEGWLESIVRTLTSIIDHLASGSGWGFGPSQPTTPEEACTSGLFFKYSDIKLEENMEASFSLNSPGANCSSNSAFGPNECCLQFGVGIDATVHAVLPKELTKDAVMTTKVSAWYKGWIPLWDSMTCKICGEPCNACPSISQYLPSVFPCQPQPTPDCPIPAGSVNEKASVTLPVDVQKTVAGSKATVTYSLTRADGSIVTSGEIFAKAS